MNIRYLSHAEEEAIVELKNRYEEEFSNILEDKKEEIRIYGACLK